MSELSVTLVQADLQWENPQANRKLLTDLVAVTQSDLIVLPEMFSTGFTMAPEKCAEPENASPTLEWMKEQAEAKKSVITGSVPIHSAKGYVNRMYWVTPEGDVTWYDKRHLFRMGEEIEHYSAGDELVTVTLKGFRIRLSVCYDLRFPVWNRNVDNDYDVLIFVASWPSARRHAWRTLLKARAIENQCYVIGVNRCGTDGNNLHYSGDSLLVDYLGEEMLEDCVDIEAVVTGVMDLDELRAFRKKFPAWMDADSFSLAEK